MPNWKVHLEVGNRINKLLKYHGDDLELFLIGNILPDINNAYILKDISKMISHNFTHYKNGKDKTYLNFYNEYKYVINNPLVLGYFVHLFTDYNWNNNYYSKIEKLSNYDNYSCEEKKQLKHNDFKTYTNNFINNKLNITNYNIIVENSKIIDRVSIDKKDLEKVCDIINNQHKYPNKYKFYNQNELDILMIKTINQLENVINNIKDEKY